MKEKGARKRWKNSTFLLAALGTGMLLNGCSQEEVKADSDMMQLNEVRFPQTSDYNKDEEPLSETFTHAYDEFVYKTAAEILKDANENVVYSPLSLYYALAAAAQGAEGKTEAEFLDLLGYENKDELADECKKSFEALYFVPNEMHRNGKEEVSAQSLYSLQIASSLWIDDDLSIKPEFADRAASYFYADVFQGNLQSEGTGKAMANWVKERTAGLIEPEAKPMQEEVLLSLRNTVYFYDEWLDRFSSEETKEDIFYTDDGREITCNFMNRTIGSAGFRKGRNFTASELLLKNGRMVFVLPDKGVDIQEFFQSKEVLREAISGTFGNCFGEVIWKVPKFSYTYQAERLKEVLETLGVHGAFGTEADFSGISADKLLLSDISQDVHIGINENGVEAAAFTEILWAGAALPKDKAEMILNRPFLYAVKHKGRILFIGICENPEER